MQKYTIRFGYFIIICVVIMWAASASGQWRKTVNLNDNWQFCFVENDIDLIAGSPDRWSPVTIPHTWNAQDIQSGSRVKYGTGWYKRTLDLGEMDIDRQYFLRFDGVGQYAALYVNKKYVGEHLGSYSAFVFNITDFLHTDSSNTILVKVNNELNDSYPKDNFLFGIFGGIYRDVSLIITENLHISLSDCASAGIYLRQKQADKKRASLRIVTLLKNDYPVRKNVLLRHRLIDKNGKSVAETTEQIILFPGGHHPVESKLRIKKPHLWNGKKDPYLYRLDTDVLYENAVADNVSQAVGLRSFTVDPKRGFILNGEPYRLYGVCRHQEWENRGNALLPENHKRDMELIRELGATSIRLAHYQQADYMYALADSMGILVWAEIPFVNGYKEGADANAKQQLTELIKQNFNHPSIFVWGLHNEVIKSGIVRQPVNLTRELHNLAKTLDPFRYTVSVSNIWWVYDHPIHGLADLQGFNQYTGWYGGKPPELEKWIKNYHAKKPDVRFAVSEYGAGGNIAHQSADIGTVPSPTGQFFPEGYQTYYHEATWAAIEKYRFIWASYIWNMFDFSVPEWNRGGIKGRNHKGLITYNRKTKKDAFFWYKANWSDEPVLYLTGRRFISRETEQTEFKAYCNFGAPELIINGESRGRMDQGINRVQYLKTGIPLITGVNLIEIKAVKNGTEYSDSYEITVK